MNTDIIDILSQSNKDPDNQMLMDYLSGKLSGEERQEVEKLISGNPFMNDAKDWKIFQIRKTCRLMSIN
jgi:hypothetical protein